MTTLTRDFVQQHKRGRNVWSRQEKGRAGELTLCTDCEKHYTCAAANKLADVRAEFNIEVPVLECPDFKPVVW